MQIDLEAVLSNSYVQSVLGAILLFIVGAFLVPRFAEFIRALTFFIFFNIRHWVSFILVGLFLHFILELPFFITLSLAIVFTSLVSFYLSFYINTKKPILLYLGSYINSDDNYLNKNLKTESIDSVVEEEFESFKASSYLIEMEVIDIKVINIPKFYILLKSYKKLLLTLRKMVKKNIVFGFSFIVNPDFINYSSYINLHKKESSNPFQQNSNAIQDILETESISERIKIKIATKINLMVITQSFNDMFLHFDDLISLNYSIEDNKKLISSINSDLDNNNIDSGTVSSFMMIFECSYHRYSAILKSKQKNYLKSAEHIFKSLDINPYFPYENHDEFKRNFATRYYLELIPVLLSHSTEDYDIPANIFDTYTILSSRLEETVVWFTLDVYNECLLHKELSAKEIESLENRLNSLEENVANLLFKSEVLKFLPKGDERYEKIYVDRLEECILNLDRINQIDPSFPLIHQKIGALKMILSSATQDNELMAEAMNSLEIGFDELKNLGLSLIEEEKIDNRSS